MAHNGDAYPKDLPATWPFRVAATVFIAAMIWFCMGFAIKDTGEELTNHMPLFWLGLLVSAVFVVGGAAFNFNREHRRKRSG